MTTNAAMVTKIKKLQALAEGASTEQERDAVNQRIADLSAKYGIDLIHEVMAGAEDEMVLKSFEINLDYADAHARLIYRVMEALGCKACMTHGEGESEIAVVGYLTDIERGELIYTSLSLQMATAVDRFCGGRGVKRTRSYLYGFADGAGEVLKAAEMAAQNDANAADVAAGRPGTAVVLADRKTQVSNAYREEFPHTSRRGGRSLDPGAYLGGQAAGRSANMGTGAGNVCQTGRQAIGA